MPVAALPDKRSSSEWLPALSAIVLVQTTCAYLTRIVPTLAPAITVSSGLSDPAIGYLSGLNMAGSIVFLVVGAPFIRRFGPLRTLLWLTGLGEMAFPQTRTLAIASFLVGVGYAPSAPAGNEVLHRFAPPAHRTLIFSIKQAGVPIGGVIAGLILPTILDRMGWTVAIGASAILVALTILVVQPMRAGTDVLRDPSISVAPGSLLHVNNLARPLAALTEDRALLRLALVGICLSAGQGVWLTFLVTMAVSALHFDLAAAGLLFAIMQATGIFGRVLLGWIADRLGSGRVTLAATILASALTSFILAFADPSWPLAALGLLAGVAGVTVTSWNGVQMAEIARLSPKGQIAEASAGATIVIFVGYVLSPVLFAALLSATGRWDIGFVAVALATLLGLLGLRRS